MGAEIICAEPSLRALGSAEAEPFIASVLAAREISDRLAARRPREPLNPRPHQDPQKRRRSPTRDYGLTGAELPEWRWLMAHKRFTALEAANILLRSRTVR